MQWWKAVPAAMSGRLSQIHPWRASCKCYLAGAGNGKGDGEADSTRTMNQTSMDRAKRIKMGQAPSDMAPCLSRPSALEKSICGYTEKLGWEGCTWRHNACRCNSGVPEKNAAH